jgi:hypothetical protein
VSDSYEHVKEQLKAVLQEKHQILREIQDVRKAAASVSMHMYVYVRVCALK